MVGGRGEAGEGVVEIDSAGKGEKRRRGFGGAQQAHHVEGDGEGLGGQRGNALAGAPRFEKLPRAGVGLERGSRTTKKCSVAEVRCQAEDFGIDCRQAGGGDVPAQCRN